jgi:hypothetical protein
MGNPGNWRMYRSFITYLLLFTVPARGHVTDVTGGLNGRADLGDRGDPAHSATRGEIFSEAEFDGLRGKFCRDSKGIFCQPDRGLESLLLCQLVCCFCRENGLGELPRSVRGLSPGNPQQATTKSEVRPPPAPFRR